MERTLPLSLSAGKKKAFLLNDLMPSFILLFTGLTSLQEGSVSLFAAANIFFGGLLLIFGVIEWRSFSQQTHHRIQWYDVVSGIVMLFDTVMMYKPWKGFQPAYLYALLSVFILLKGFSVIQPPRPRRLIVNEHGMKIRTGPFSSLSMEWNNILSITMNDKKISVSTNDGDHSISLRSIENVNDIREVLVEACSSKQISFL